MNGRHADIAFEAPNLALEFLRWVRSRRRLFRRKGQSRPGYDRVKFTGHSHCELARMTEAASEVARLIAGSPLWRSLSCM